MKNFVILTLLIVVNLSSFAQIVRPKEVFRRKTEQRVNDKVDQGADKVLDAIFSPKKRTKTDKPKNEEATEDTDVSETTTSTDQAPDISTIVGNLNMGGKPSGQYNFVSSITVQMKMTDPKKKKQNFSMKYKYAFADNLKALSVKFLESDNPDMQKASGMMDAMVMDFEQEKMFTFMNNDGKKTVMGMGFKSDPTADRVQENSDKITVKKLPETKTIAGYKCDAYLVEDSKEKSKIIMWVSQKSVGEMAAFATKLSRNSPSFGSKNASSNNYMAYNTQPEFLKMAREGRMCMGFTSEGEKGEVSEMEVIEISPSDKSAFNTTAYKSMF